MYKFINGINANYQSNGYKKVKMQMNNIPAQQQTSAVAALRAGSAVASKTV